jgi:hypothetical protein
VLLIDDVVTTGATVRCCAGRLLDAGVQQVMVLAVAHRVSRTSGNVKKTFEFRKFSWRRQIVTVVEQRPSFAVLGFEVGTECAIKFSAWAHLWRLRKVEGENMTDVHTTLGDLITVLYDELLLDLGDSELAKVMAAAMVNEMILDGREPKREIAAAWLSLS